MKRFIRLLATATVLTAVMVALIHLSSGAKPLRFVLLGPALIGSLVSGNVHQPAAVVVEGALWLELFLAALVLLSVISLVTSAIRLHGSPPP